MKRSKPTYPVVKIITPFSWKECRFCKREFRKESGYEIKDMTFANPHLHWSYCCNECAKSIEDVKRLVNGTKLNIELLRKCVPKIKSNSNL
jgi:hypothetical protein